MVRSLVLALAVMLPAQALAQVPEAKPREAVAAIATEIRERYFSAEKGDAIADALETEAAAGKYDALKDPRDLASALANRLRPEDAHFNVIWSAEAAAAPLTAGPAMRAPGGGPPPGQQPADGFDPFSLVNYGFASAEILPGNVGVITMRLFANIDFDNPDDPARRAADAALAMVANTDAVVFDLRNNGGGAPSMVGYLVSAFTKPDADIYNTFHSRQGTRSEKPGVFYGRPRLEVPVYVLTSGRTGSAAEAMPYTLQAAKRATIVGEATGGAANPGGIVPIAGGYAVFISAGSPINPITKTNWEGAGVKPDVATPAADALTTAQIRALTAIAAEDPERTDAVWALAALKSAVKLDEAQRARYVGVYGPLEVVAVGDRLEVRRGRRPALELVPLGADVFFVRTDPVIRFKFERDATGAAVAVEQRDPFGPAQRQRRNP